jgi:hypothetical protein
VQLAFRPERDVEAERQGERLGPPQVRLRDLQPGEPLNLDDRVPGTSGVLPWTRPLLAVQAGVGAWVCHVVLLRVK